MKRFFLPTLLLFWLTSCNYPGLAGAPFQPQDSTNGDCYYVWASQDLPELSQKVNQALQTEDENMSGSAYAYGEDCVFADRQRAFSAMETDFRVKVKVRDLGDKKALGDWMAKALQVIVSLPADEISGPQLGRVEFEFDATRSENLFVNVPLDQYQHRARELRGAELFDFFYDNP